jgi:hypothetical protein
MLKIWQCRSTNVTWHFMLLAHMYMDIMVKMMALMNDRFDRPQKDVIQM